MRIPSGIVRNIVRTRCTPRAMRVVPSGAPCFASGSGSGSGAIPGRGFLGVPFSNWTRTKPIAPASEPAQRSMVFSPRGTGSAFRNVVLKSPSKKQAQVEAPVHAPIQDAPKPQTTSQHADGRESSVAQVGGHCAVYDRELLVGDQVADNAECVSRLQLNRAVLRQVQQQVANGEQDAFYVVDMGALHARYALWHEYLPDVQPHYAVKCNPDVEMIRQLASLGAGFDCASQAELDRVLQCGVPADQIIYANPCKQPSNIAFAMKHNVDTMTFDCVDELTKIKAITPNAKMVLRLYVDDTKATSRLGTKFGAMLHDVPAILAHAKQLDMQVIGVSFHVGSGCFDVTAYSDAVKRARKAFNVAEEMGFKFTLLDIGGGFPGTLTAPIKFEDCAKELKTALEANFPKSSGIRIISEPGRFFAASTHTLVANVIGRKVAPTYDIPGSDPNAKDKTADGQENSTAPNYMYFLNDGLYGSFNGLVFDHMVLQPVVVADNVTDANMDLASVWGPTCDGMDCILREIKLPVMGIGQWMVFASMGAYSCAAASDFNGFSVPKKVYVDTRDAPKDMQVAALAPISIPVPSSEQPAAIDLTCEEQVHLEPTMESVEPQLVEVAQ